MVRVSSGGREQLDRCVTPIRATTRGPATLLQQGAPPKVMRPQLHLLGSHLEQSERTKYCVLLSLRPLNATETQSMFTEAINFINHPEILI